MKEQFVVWEWASTGIPFLPGQQLRKPLNFPLSNRFFLGHSSFCTPEKHQFRVVLEVSPEFDHRASVRRHFTNCHFPLSLFVFHFAYKIFPSCPCYSSPPDKSISALIHPSRWRRIFVCLIKETLLGHSFVEIGMRLWHNQKRSNWIIRSSFEKELIWAGSLFSQLCPLHSAEAAPTLELFV